MRVLSISLCLGMCLVATQAHAASVNFVESTDILALHQGAASSGGGIYYSTDGGFQHAFEGILDTGVHTFSGSVSGNIQAFFASGADPGDYEDRYILDVVTGLTITSATVTISNLIGTTGDVLNQTNNSVNHNAAGPTSFFANATYTLDASTTPLAPIFGPGSTASFNFEAQSVITSGANPYPFGSYDYLLTVTVADATAPEPGTWFLLFTALPVVAYYRITRPSNRAKSMA